MCFLRLFLIAVCCTVLLLLFSFSLGCQALLAKLVLLLSTTVTISIVPPYDPRIPQLLILIVIIIITLLPLPSLLRHVLVAFAVFVFDFPGHSIRVLTLFICNLIWVVSRRVQILAVRAFFLVAELVVCWQGVVQIIQRYLRVLVVGSCRTTCEPG